MKRFTVRTLLFSCLCAAGYFSGAQIAFTVNVDRRISEQARRLHNDALRDSVARIYMIGDLQSHDSSEIERLFRGAVQNQSHFETYDNRIIVFAKRGDQLAIKKKLDEIRSAEKPKVAITTFNPNKMFNTRKTETGF